MRRRRLPLAGALRMVLPSTAMTILSSMAPVRVQNHNLRRVLRPMGPRSCRTLWIVD